MNTNNEENTSMTKKTFKPLRIQLYSHEFNFETFFEITFEVKKRASLRELAKYLIGLGYVAMEYNEFWDVVWVSKNLSFLNEFNTSIGEGKMRWEPLTITGLTRMMGYAA